MWELRGALLGQVSVEVYCAGELASNTLACSGEASGGQGIGLGWQEQAHGLIKDVFLLFLCA